MQIGYTNYLDFGEKTTITTHDSSQANNFYMACAKPAVVTQAEFNRRSQPAEDLNSHYRGNKCQVRSPLKQPQNNYKQKLLGIEK